MFFNRFTDKSKPKADLQQFRSDFSDTFHLGEHNVTFCGMKLADSSIRLVDRQVSKQEVLSFIPGKGSNWYWCPKCLEALQA